MATSPSTWLDVGQLQDAEGRFSAILGELVSRHDAAAPLRRQAAEELVTLRELVAQLQQEKKELQTELNLQAQELEAVKHNVTSAEVAKRAMEVELEKLDVPAMKAEVEAHKMAKYWDDCKGVQTGIVSVSLPTETLNSLSGDGNGGEGAEAEAQKVSMLQSVVSSDLGVGVFCVRGTQSSASVDDNTFDDLGVLLCKLQMNSNPSGSTSADGTEDAGDNTANTNTNCTTAGSGEAALWEYNKEESIEVSGIVQQEGSINRSGALLWDGVSNVDGTNGGGAGMGMPAPARASLAIYSRRCRRSDTHAPPQRLELVQVDTQLLDPDPETFQVEVYFSGLMAKSFDTAWQDHIASAEETRNELAEKKADEKEVKAVNAKLARQRYVLLTAARLLTSFAVATSLDDGELVVINFSVSEVQESGDLSSSSAATASTLSLYYCGICRSFIGFTKDEVEAHAAMEHAAEVAEAEAEGNYFGAVVGVVDAVDVLAEAVVFALSQIAALVATKQQRVFVCGGLGSTFASTAASGASVPKDLATACKYHGCSILLCSPHTTSGDDGGQQQTTDVGLLLEPSPNTTQIPLPVAGPTAGSGSGQHHVDPVPPATASAGSALLFDL